MSAASTKWPVKPTIASARPPGDGTTSTTPSAGGKVAERGRVVEHDARAGGSATSRSASDSASSSSAAVYGSGLRAATSSTTVSNTGPRHTLGARAPAVLGRDQPRSSSRRRAPRRACVERRPSPRGARGAPAIARHSSSMPSPVVATVRTIGGRHVARPDSSSIRSRSRTVSAAPAPVGLVHDEARRRSPAARPWRPAPRRPTRVHDDDRRVGVPGDLDLDLTDADRLDDDPRLARPRRAPGPPAASRARARRGGRASPSSG